jgi:hypothetical protein
MSGNSNNGPMIKATGLWQKTSVKGGQYLTGRPGGLKVLIMENRDQKTDDDPSHHLFVAEAPDRRQERGDVARAPQDAPDEPEAPRASPERLPGAWAAGVRSSGAARP